MPGGIMQLTMYGTQDMYLTGNPSTTFFKMVYKRYTNFVSEYIAHSFNSLPTFNPTTQTLAKCKVNRYADLMYDTYLIYDLPALFSSNSEPVGWCEYVGHSIIDYVEIFVGGKRLDKQYGRWMTIWNELTLSDSKKKTLNKLIGNDNIMYSSGGEYIENDTTSLSIPPRRLYIPLTFWYCTNPGLAIPLIALQSSEIYININYNALNTIFKIGNPLVSPEYLFSNNSDLSEFNIDLANTLRNGGYDQSNIFHKYTVGWKQNSYLLINYIYLDEDERKRFAQLSHEYLITQVQTINLSGLKTGPNILDISVINHCVKEFIWVIQDPDVSDINDWSNYTMINNNSKLTLNGYKYIQSLIAQSRDIGFKNINNSILQQLSSNKVKDLFNNVRYDINTESLQYPDIINRNINNYIDIMKSATIMFNGIKKI